MTATGATIRSMARTVTFWRLRLAETLMGLFRRTDLDGSPVEFAYLGEDGWVDDPTLFSWWLDPGDRDLVEVDRAEAEGVALAQDTGLDDEAVAR